MSAASSSKFSAELTENAVIVELPTVSDNGSTAVQWQVQPETGHSEWSLKHLNDNLYLKTNVVQGIRTRLTRSGWKRSSSQ